MPGLGFLKKKRTREGHPDHSAASNPSSTVTTSSHHQQQPSGGAAIGASGVASAGGQTTASGGAAAPPPQPPQPPPQHHQQGGQSNPHAHHQPHHQQPPAPAQPSGAGTRTEGASNPPHDPQNPNAPSINNLANAPQNDGAAHAKSSNQINLDASHPNTSAASLGPAIVPTASASPGTNPDLLQQQQQAARPPPPQQESTNTDAMQTDQPEQQPQQASAQQGQQQHASQPQQQQQQQSGHQQQASTSSTARVTKGKYTLNDFDILRTLGTGSFGRVHLVQSKHNQRFYAIKVLKKAQVVKMKQVEHTNDERRMLSDVKHPFLVTLWGTFCDWKNLYMVMDFVEGGELFSLLRKSGRFPNPVAKFYAAEVTLALEYMHSKNIVYRDLKPENLLLDRHGHLKITDFGFAKRVPDKTWTLCGTPDYLAPEVVSNKGYNKSVDWWSLGILIYEMLCGYTPFWDSGSPMRIYENILKGKVKYPAYIVPEAQDLLQKLITADLTKRLGNLYGGSTDVKNHPWFHEVTWDRLARKDIDAPYTPPVKAGAGDASQFDKYPEEQDKYGQSSGADDFGHLFTEF